MFFLFRRAKEPKKSRLGLFPGWIAFIRFKGYGCLYKRGGARCAVSRFFVRYEPAAFTIFVGDTYHAVRYLKRFGIPRIEFTFLGRLRPRRIHRHASGAAQEKVGVLPALNHKSELSAGRDHPDAIKLYSMPFIIRAHHKLEWARKISHDTRASV